MTQEICLCLLVSVFQFISFLTKWKIVSNSTRASKTLPGRIRRGSRTRNRLGASGDGASVKGDSTGKRALGTRIQLTGCIQTRLQWPTGGGWPRGELSTSIPIVNGISRFLGKKKIKEQNQQKTPSSFSPSPALRGSPGPQPPLLTQVKQTPPELGELLLPSPRQQRIPQVAGVAWHGSSPRAARGHCPSPGLPGQGSCCWALPRGCCCCPEGSETLLSLYQRVLGHLSSPEL